MMDLAVVGSLAAAVAAFIAAGIATWQAVSARQQVAEARAQREVAQSQLELAREQARLVQAAHDEAQGPAFELDTMGVIDRGVRSIIVKYVDGPNLAEVRVVDKPDHVVLKWRQPTLSSDEVEWTLTTLKRPGDSQTFGIVAPPRKSWSLTLSCVEDGGVQRTWRRTLRWNGSFVDRDTGIIVGGLPKDLLRKNAPDIESGSTGVADARSEEASES